MRSFTKIQGLEYQVSFHETWSDVDVLEVGRHSIKVETVLTTSTNGSHVAHSDYLNVMLVPKQFIRMDRPKQSCDWQGSDHVVACRNECFERAVTSVTGCKYDVVLQPFFVDSNKQLSHYFQRFYRLPFMKNERVPYCSNSSSVTLAEELSEKLITDGVSGCYCLHSCNEVLSIFIFFLLNHTIKKRKQFNYLVWLTGKLFDNRFRTVGSTKWSNSQSVSTYWRCIIVKITTGINKWLIAWFTGLLQYSAVANCAGSSRL